MDSLDEEEVYEVEKVIDIKWEENCHGKEEERYRVRWKGFKPIHDTWEPFSSFMTESQILVQNFRERYESLKKPITIYFVKWHGYDCEDATWEADSELIHASDKIETFLRKQHVDYSKHHSEYFSDEALLTPDDPHPRRCMEDELFSDFKKGKSVYTRVKSRKSSDKVHDKSTGVHPSITDGLPKYNPKRVQEVFKKQINFTLSLSKQEFCSAVQNDDYQKVMASLRSGNIPDVDFPSLFLAAARQGQRDVALLLSTRVPDISVKDDWGETAFTMAAHNGDVSFAHQLLILGVPLKQQNKKKQTAQDIAVKLGHKQFLKFLRKYEEKRESYLRVI
nr:uncharacterized protein LOC128684525 isoform X2 [Cherax quadricarinatus]